MTRMLNVTQQKMPFQSFIGVAIVACAFFASSPRALAAVDPQVVVAGILWNVRSDIVEIKTDWGILKVPRQSVLDMRGRIPKQATVKARLGLLQFEKLNPSPKQ